MTATAPTQTGPRVEWKVLMPPQEADALFAWTQQRMAPDPHIEDPGDSSYLVESIYFDTPDRACLRTNPERRLPKYRARRYNGNDDGCFLEEKTRRGDLVWKRRLPCQQTELPAVTRGQRVLDDATEWFRALIHDLRMQPTLLVVYQRRALTLGGDRLTIDRAIDCSLPRGVEFTGVNPHRILDREVLELKFEGEPSALACEILQRASSARQGCSKYALGMRAVGGDRQDAATA